MKPWKSIFLTSWDVWIKTYILSKRLYFRKIDRGSTLDGFYANVCILPSEKNWLEFKWLFIISILPTVFPSALYKIYAGHWGLCFKPFHFHQQKTPLWRAENPGATCEKSANRYSNFIRVFPLCNKSVYSCPCLCSHLLHTVIPFLFKRMKWGIRF